MRLDKEEKNIVEKITTLSFGKDPNIVKNILECLFVTISMEMVSGNNAINIPYLGEMKVIAKRKIIDNKPEIEVSLKMTPSKILKEEIKCMMDDIKTPSEEMFKKLISIEIGNILDIDSYEYKLA